MELKVKSTIKFMALLLTITGSYASEGRGSDDEDNNSKYLEKSYRPEGFDREKALEEGRKNRLERRDSVKAFRKLDPDGRFPDQPKVAGDASTSIRKMAERTLKKVQKICSIAQEEQKNFVEARKILSQKLESHRLSWVVPGGTYIDRTRLPENINFRVRPVCEVIQESYNDALSIANDISDFFIPEFAKFAANAEVELLKIGIDVDHYQPDSQAAN